jgi:ABC-type phosphate transport system substrate-binding protein
MRKVVVLACIFSILVAALALVGCGSGSGTSSSGTPEKVAQTFWKAAMTGDGAASWALLSKSIQTRFKNKDAWAKSGVTNTLGSGTIEVGKAKITGDTATVTIKVMMGGTVVTTEEVSLVKEGGAWKIEMP